MPARGVTDPNAALNPGITFASIPVWADDSWYSSIPGPEHVAGGKCYPRVWPLISPGGRKLAFIDVWTGSTGSTGLLHSGVIFYSQILAAGDFVRPRLYSNDNVSEWAANTKRTFTMSDSVGGAAKPMAMWNEDQSGRCMVGIYIMVSDVGVQPTLQGIQLGANANGYRPTYNGLKKTTSYTTLPTTDLTLSEVIVDSYVPRIVARSA